MDTYEQTRNAYMQGTATLDVPRQVELRHKTPTEMASLGYALEARARDNHQTPATRPLGNVLALIDGGTLPESLRSIAVSPPTREEARYLHPEVQRMVTELATLDKAIGAMPGMEREAQSLRGQKDDWTREAIRLGVTDKHKSAGNVSYPHQLETVEDALSKVAVERDSIIRGAMGYATNNAEIVDRSSKMLGTLRQQLQAPQPFAEAKAGIPAQRKTVRAWLDDVGGQPSLDDRVLAQKVLEAGGIDHAGILTEVSRQGMSLVDAAIAEAKSQVQ